MDLTDKDQQLIALLQQNGRLSVSEMARKLSVSPWESCQFSRFLLSKRDAMKVTLFSRVDRRAVEQSNEEKCYDDCALAVYCEVWLQTKSY